MTPSSASRCTAPRSGEYVDAIWGWDEPVQRAYHDQNFDVAHTRVITVDGRDAGVLTVEEAGTEVVLGLIELVPAYQGRGFGGHLVRELATRAASRGRDVVLRAPARSTSGWVSS
ncbi:GNAT superfamily N-acetyltransferase [Amycolatopsis lexingtonensis]|uniref:GNAT superfamily N-acetyltransferase n=1 Tax=Amycolatopsis lexingtonensis TaxID=218822 RepID=A0ABR9HV06_9PSEU|nr:GNAT family N-acetyltransferase [Amycolatopsis lexingtonensis]MBE1494750.1 GNAT superfamily N-acetyltransferase [Amycolatopsis lexingtonensis]